MQGRVVAITGGFGVLGRAIGTMAAARGAKVALIDRAEAPRGLPDDVLGLGSVDLTDYASAQGAMKAVADHFGGLDALCNIAGGFRWETLADGELDSWDFLYQINVKTAVTASKAALKLLENSKAGRIVNVGAAGAVKAGMGMGAYAASKAGVMRLTEALAEETKSGPVTVNAVLPSIIDTPQNRADMPDTDPKTWVAPDDLAEVVLFLASEASRAMTGALVPVTGKV
ncbi:SDR family NAD(P)-dependent oxidoreductase [Hyphobacterium marinum]|uniref:SDR family NAD(P)-dependent oxidoreductase n=1 Tax=Hyphobacterium marinum TaxID=3116574 RepID=A0ABU7LW12_9PROT|nr:SDR family NAD(P)-dependent oxidoreductase [Hyphobacterium sp. Y6023]MEE2565704.1 SDR family NAD(P)-dependent oxidoreductase [Hyphobacterium sp. Y6023]